jgi:succinate dehydrogenase hydrophobic membrane anchor protein
MRQGEGAAPRESRKTHAASRFFQKRFTSMLLVPLTVVAIFLGVTLAGDDQATVARILGQPIIAIALFAFIVLVAVHMTLGVIDIIGDYVHTPVVNRLATLASIAYAAIVVAASGYALLKFSFGD